MIEEIEELLMKNKKISKQKDEQQAALEDGNRRNIAMKRNIEEVWFLNPSHYVIYLWKMEIILNIPFWSYFGEEQKWLKVHSIQKRFWKLWNPKSERKLKNFI